MAYRFATEKENYSDFASGHVFYSVPNQPVFPVRLASEVFQRALTFLKRKDNSEPLSLYDPCCGSAYHLAVLGVLHRAQLSSITASDINPESVKLATRNLSLLTAEGLAERRRTIDRDWQQFGKNSHLEALSSVDRIATKLSGTPPLLTHCFVADATAPVVIADDHSTIVDLIITDLPYGQLSAWQGRAKNNAPIWNLLEQLRPLLHKQSVVALATTKEAIVEHEQYRRCGRFRHGKRLITFLKQIGS